MQEYMGKAQFQEDKEFLQKIEETYGERIKTLVEARNSL